MNLFKERWKQAASNTLEVLRNLIVVAIVITIAFTVIQLMEKFTVVAFIVFVSLGLLSILVLGGIFMGFINWLLIEPFKKK